MSPIDLFFFVRYYINLLLSLVLVIAAIYALVEAVRASDYAYRSAFKRTKGFWVALTGGSAAFSSLMLLQAWSYGANSVFIQLVSATAVGVFLADVRPAVAVRRRR